MKKIIALFFLLCFSISSTATILPISYAKDVSLAIENFSTNTELEPSEETITEYFPDLLDASIPHNDCP